MSRKYTPKHSHFVVRQSPSLDVCVCATYNNVGGQSFKGSTMTTFPTSSDLNQVLSRAGHVSCINLCSLEHATVLRTRLSALSRI